MTPLEVEVKFFVADPAAVRARLAALEGQGSGPVFERNLRFEDAGNSLFKRNALLRLRKDENARLTFKSEPAEKNTQCKVFNELEVSIGDFSTMQRILEELGFHVEQIYEKYRETFHFDDVEICIDELPFGTFIEIEGSEEKIRHWAADLGFSWDRRILENYLAIFQRIREKERLPFSDVTFENFQCHAVDMAAYLDDLQAGG